jgi:phosphatidylinositol phospholipase C delta
MFDGHLMHVICLIKAGKPKDPLVDALKNDPDKVRRLSLSEQELAKVAANHGPNIVRFVC